MLEGASQRISAASRDLGTPGIWVTPSESELPGSSGPNVGIRSQHHLINSCTHYYTLIKTTTSAKVIGSWEKRANI